jgi:hypothetical protein
MEADVSDPVDSLVIDLLEWIGPNPRPSGEVLDAWRTSCPRLPVWEEANDRGFVIRIYEAGKEPLISVTEAGNRHVRAYRSGRQLEGASSMSARDDVSPRSP